MTTSDIDLSELRPLFAGDDGLLPDISFNFRGAAVVDAAYALVQRHASALDIDGACYWSKRRGTICPIELGDNPAAQLLRGDAEAFRVVFTGLRADTGSAMPDLGMFVLDRDFLALEYRMGAGWSDCAIAGLLDLMREMASLAVDTVVGHEGHAMDPHGEILISVFNKWRSLRASSQM